jgi:hypothetical protein
VAGHEVIKTVEHKLKTWPRFFEELLRGNKTFELRRNDRDFQTGDDVIFREWDEKLEDFTGRKLRRTIIYVLRAEDISKLSGLQTGYCIFSFTGAAIKWLEERV